MKKNIILLMHVFILFGSSCSSQKCIKYNNDILSIEECTVRNLILHVNEKRSKTDSVINVSKENYSQYKKIGEFEIVQPLDLEHYERNFIYLILAIDSSNLRKLVNLEMNEALEEINKKAIDVAKINNSTGIYLVGIKTEADNSYSQNNEKKTINSGCKNYIFCKYELLTK